MGKEHLIPFKKGQSGNPNGRPRKLLSIATGHGYNKVDVIQTIENIMAMDLEQLRNVIADEKATILEKTIANAMWKSLKNGSLYSIDALLNRIYGKPKETIDTNTKVQLEGKLQVDVVKSSVPLSNRETDVDVNK